MEPDRLRRQNRPCSPQTAGACRPRCLHVPVLARRSPVARPEGSGVSARLEPGSRGAGSPRSDPTSDPYRRSAPPHLAPLSRGRAPCQARRREPGRCGAGGESWRAHRGVNPLEWVTPSLSAPDPRVRRSGYASRKAERCRTPPASPAHSRSALRSTDTNRILLCVLLERAGPASQPASSVYVVAAWPRRFILVCTPAARPAALARRSHRPASLWRRSSRPALEAGGRSPRCTARRGRAASRAAQRAQVHRDCAPGGRPLLHWKQGTGFLIGVRLAGDVVSRLACSY